VHSTRLSASFTATHQYRSSPHRVPGPGAIPLPRLISPAASIGPATKVASARCARLRTVTSALKYPVRTRRAPPRGD
jgi:hypothetical protein